MPDTASSDEDNKSPDRTRGPRRREGGRDARRTKRQAQTTSPAVWPGIRGGSYKPLSEHDINIPYTMMTATEKPLCFAFRSSKSVRPAVEMFDMVLGGEGRFQKEPFAIFGGYPIAPPLMHGRKRVPVIFIRAVSRLSGKSLISIGPVTLMMQSIVRFGTNFQFF